MSCSQSKQFFSKSAAVCCGIHQTASKSANLAGSGTKRAVAWVNENPGKAAMTGGSPYAVGLTALYNYKRRRIWETTGSLAVTGIKTSIHRTGQEPGQAEFDLAAQVDQGLYLVEQRIGRPDISRVTLADIFDFSDAMADMAQCELSKGNRKQRRVAKAYKVMRPMIVGQYFLRSRIKQLPLGGGDRIAISGLSGEEIAINLDQLRSKKAKKLNKRMGGQYAAYVAAHEALHRLPRVYQPGGRRIGRMREEALVDAIATRLVNPEFRGRRSGYHLIARVADWQARRVAQKTGEDPVDVLVRNLDVASRPA